MKKKEPEPDPAQRANKARSKPASSSGYVSGYATTPPDIPDHELLRRIGGGSYGDVWLARNVMGTYRAIKVVYRETFEHDRPYEREFEGIKQFEPISRRHESQVDILHVGQNRQAGYFYYVMELADPAERSDLGSQSPGPRIPTSSECESPETYVPRTLKYDLNHWGTVPFEQCVRIGLALTTALDHLHCHNLVHRDIKPSNIIFVNGSPKLADIGLVSAVDATVSFVGTAGYMPVEGPGTVQADIYSLGKVLYEISTGQDRKEFPALPDDIQQLSQRNELIELNAILLKACENDPAKRYQTATELQADLELLRSGKSIRRLRRLERRLEVGRKMMLLLLAVSMLATVAVYQSRKTTQLARDFASRLQVTTGIQLMEQGNLFRSLTYLTEGLARNPSDMDQEHDQRVRLTSVLGECPKPIAILTHDEEPVVGAALHPDGMHLLTLGGDQSVRLWDVGTGESKGVLPHENQILQASFAPTGIRVLTSTVNNRAHLWDWATRARIGKPLVHHHLGQGLRKAYFVGLSHTHFMGFKSGAFSIYDESLPFTNEIRNLTLVLLLKTQGSNVVATASVLDNGNTNAVLITETAVDTPGQDVMKEGMDDSPGTHAGWPGFFALMSWKRADREADAASVTFDNPRVRVIDESGSKDRPLDDFEGDTLNDWSFWGSRSSGVLMTNGEITITASADPQENTAGVFYCLERFSVDSTQALELRVDLVRSSPSALAILALGSPRIGAESPIPSFSADGRHVLTLNSRDRVGVYDAATGEEIGTFPHARPEALTRRSADNPWLLTGGGSEQAAILYVRSGRRVLLNNAAQTAQTGGDSAVVFHPGRGVFRTREPHLWDPGSGESRKPALRHLTAIESELSPDGTRLVTGSEGRVEVWDAFTGEQLLEIPLPRERLERAVFSPDGRHVLTWTTDNVLRLWDVDTGDPIIPPIEGVVGLPAEPFGAHGRLLAAIHREGVVRVWDLAKLRPAVLPIWYNAWYDPSRKVKAGSLSDRSLDPVGGESGTSSAVPLLQNREAYVVAGGKFLIAENSGAGAQVLSPSSGEPLTPLLQTRFVIDESESLDLDLIPDRRPASVLIAEAQLLTGVESDRRGFQRVLALPSLTGIWNRLSGTDEFATSGEGVRLWHETMAGRSEHAWDWWAAIYHLDQLTLKRPEDENLLARRRYAREALANAESRSTGYRERRRVIPPRPLGIEPNITDLSTSYNISLKEPLQPDEPGTDLAALPTGRREFAGEWFDVRGGILLAGQVTEGWEKDLPKARSIHVGRKCSRLHVLHACVGSSGGNKRIASYILHYSNGGTNALPVISSMDTSVVHSRKGFVSPRNAELAWIGKSSHVESGRAAMRLFKRTYENPNPELEIESIEFVSHLKFLAPLLIAITLEE